MANQNSIPDLSTTPASNTNWRGQSIQGPVQLAMNLDEAERNISAMLAAMYDSLGGVAAVSGTNTLTVTISEDWAALADGLLLAIKAVADNTGAVTLAVTVPTAGALAAKAIRLQGDTALSGGEIKNKGIYLLRYDSAYNSAAGAWVLLNVGNSLALPVSSANGGTGLTSPTANSVVLTNGSSAYQTVAPSTSGNVLTSNGTTWQSSAPAAPGLSLLTSGTWSSQATGDLVLTGYTGYRGIQIELSNIVPVSDGAVLQMRVSTNGGTSYDSGSTDYKFAMNLVYSDTGNNATNSNGAAQASVSGDAGNGAAEGMSGTIKCMGQASTTAKPKFTVDSLTYRAADTIVKYQGIVIRNAAQDTDAIRFFFSTGNISSGSYAVYGYN